MPAQLCTYPSLLFGLLLVSSGLSASARPDQPVDVAIIHMEITQGLQDQANSIHLVKGKPTVIRVFPAVIAGKPVQNVTCLLHAFRNGKELPFSPIKPANGSITAEKHQRTEMPNRSDPTKSLDFILLLDWYAKQTDFYAEIVLPAGVKDPDLKNNRFPTTGFYNATFLPRRGLTIQYVMITIDSPKWTKQRTPRSRVSEPLACDFARSIFPTDPSLIVYAPFSPSAIVFSDITAGGDIDSDSLINQLNLFWASNKKPPDRLFAWLPDGAYSGNGNSDPVWAPGQGHVAFGNDTGDAAQPLEWRWRRTFAHELGHLTNANGLQHTPRQLKADEYGYDVLRVDPFKRVVMRRFPPEDPTGQLDLYDFMHENEVEAHAWITPDSYEEIFASLKPSSADSDQGSKGDQSDHSPKNMWAISGSITKDGKGSLATPLIVPVTGQILKLASTSPKMGTHQLRFYSKDREEIGSRISWTPDFRQFKSQPINAEKTVPSRPFVFYRDFDDRINKIALVIEGSTVAIKETIVSKEHGPRVGNVAQQEIAAGDNPTQRQHKLSWESFMDEANPADVVHQVYYSNDKGNTWNLVATGLKSPEAFINVGSLPGGNEGLFQIRSTDGFNLATKTFAAKPFKTSPPEFRIIAPKDDLTINEDSSLLLIGHGFDFTKGVLPSESLTWTSDQQGKLGKGGKLILTDLKPGQHTISLGISPNDKNAAKIKLIVEPKKHNE